MKTRALFFEGARAVTVREIELPEPGPGEVRVRGLASAISQGTELLLYLDEGPAVFDPSLGAASYPSRYGYAWIGEREDTGARVFGLLPHGDAHVVALDRLRAMRADVPATRAALAANLETAITCVWDAEPVLGERAVVLGGGVVGALTAWLLARSGVDVELVEPRAGRRAAAAALVRAVASRSDAADLVVEATGDPAALDAAIAIAAPEARVVVASFYGRRRAAIDLGDAFHRRRLRLVASQVSSIPPRLRAGWTFDRRFDLVSSLLGDPALDALVAPPVRFGTEEASAVYAELAAGADDAPPCRVFEY
ncbi:MAG: hypothetical protein KIT84_07045 [Labilithrix sp.]|nr:hypothetical protein [Labilithrix sp.]MCW5810751.1 hypothetical protein [Labilithrix sp.]